MLSLCLIVLLLLKGSESCRLSDEGEAPKITPANSNHIQISWEGVFEGCSDTNVKEVYVQKYGGQTLRMDGAKYSHKRALVKLSPCLQHRMMVTLALGNNRYLPTPNSAIYNEVSYEAKYNDYKTLYAGLLDKEVVQKTCMEKTNMVVTIPEPPPGLTKCIVEKEIISSSIILGQSWRIRFVIVNPENEHQFINVEADVDKLDFCQDENPTGRDEDNSRERGQESVTERKMENTTERGKENATEKGEGITSERGEENTSKRGKEITKERNEENDTERGNRDTTERGHENITERVQRPLSSLNGPELGIGNLTTEVECLPDGEDRNSTCNSEEKDKDFVIPLHVLAAVVGVSGVILFGGLVSLLILCFKKRRARKAMRPGRVDQNPVYGHSEAYYMGREWMQMEDTSPHYGVGDEGWEDFAQDRNPYYE